MGPTHTGCSGQEIDTGREHRACAGVGSPGDGCARTVDIGPALTEQLKLQLQRKDFTVVPPGGRADAKLTTRATYGLATAQLASETRLVSLVMFLELTAADGRVLYRHQYFAGNDRPFYTEGKLASLNRWLTDEALVEEQNERMVERAAAQITQGL
jgi:hypothetical protein